MQVTLGGDRLGSGNKNKIALRNYERSTHDLTQKFTSSLQCGTLYPFLIIPAMRGDKFDIYLDADARTIPTKGPLFGSFKMQLDLFQSDIRLYQAILHNNPLAIGLKMNQVMFPQLRVQDMKEGNAFNNTCLLKYLGMSGLYGGVKNGISPWREINAIPALAYYEIFKTYYANKQEENAYVIGTEIHTGNINDFNFTVNNNTNGLDTNFTFYNGMIAEINARNVPFEDYSKYINITYLNSNDDELLSISIADALQSWGNGDPTQTWIKRTGTNQIAIFIPAGAPITGANIAYIQFTKSPLMPDNTYTWSEQGLQPFALANIDDMRLKLLSHHELGSPFQIKPTEESEYGGDWGTNSGTDGTGLPYSNLVTLNDEEGATRNVNSLNGLVVKTYQSDLFNNWVNTEWIDGENGIANVTAISTESGSIKVDAVNLAEKLYNMLNRVAVSDGSYEGWQDAVYTETPKRHIESPVYLGGMSSEIMFEEIVQTSQGDGNNPLGTLGGKGKLFKRKGGHVTVKCNEAAFIIGIVSLTPRVNYTQGNEWYMTELLTMDDFHKPALDGIGFQDLIGERLAWWDTVIGNGRTLERSKIGKLPAWIDYMTAVDKCYGDFAETEGRGFMALQRDYERDTETGKIKDATTYIDPRKYNYAFANTAIDAQNFWVQIKSSITARRLMSAKQIPNI